MEKKYLKKFKKIQKHGQCENVEGYSWDNIQIAERRMSCQPVLVNQFIFIFFFLNILATKAFSFFVFMSFVWNIICKISASILILCYIPNDLRCCIQDSSRTHHIAFTLYIHNVNKLFSVKSGRPYFAIQKKRKKNENLKLMLIFLSFVHQFSYWINAHGSSRGRKKIRRTENLCAVLKKKRKENQLHRRWFWWRVHM